MAKKCKCCGEVKKGIQLETAFYCFGCYGYLLENEN